MSYKKDMLFIMTVVLILGTVIQAARTDLISTIAAEGRLSGKTKRNYSVNAEYQIMVSRSIKTRHTVLYDLYSGLKKE